jgi:hypothetical protein
MHPFGKLTRDELRILRDRFYGNPPSPDEWQTIERLKKWLDEANRR